MADINEFLKKLGITPQQAPLSPLMDAADLRPESDEFAYDPADDMPAVDEDEGPYVAPMKKGAPLMSKSVIDQIQAIPLPESQKSVRVPAEAAAPELPPMSSPTAAPTDKSAQMKSLLEQYQAQRQSKQDGLNGLRGMNQIIQGMASKYGGETGDGSEAINALESQLDQPTKDYKARIDNEMDEPNSDISKFMRQQAYAILKKLSPETSYDGKLENMSANQLQKLPGMKNALGSSGGGLAWVATDRVTANGHPVKFNKATGTMHDAITDELIADGESVVRDIARRDPLTGNYGYVSRNNGMQVMPTNYGATVQGKEQPNGKPKEYNFGDVQNAGAEVADRVEKSREKFNTDMKESREVATSVTNLASKLKPGVNGEVDSGLLGGIQTQAAKMAGQKGVLTDQDLVKFAGAGGVAAKLARIGTNLQGDMSDADVKFFKRFAQLMGKSLDSDIQNRSELFAEQNRQSLEKFLPGISTENVKKFLAVDKVAPIVQDESTSTKSGEVKRKTADGQVAIFDAKTKKFLRYEKE